MEVIILAGGLGTRLRSVVKEVPKCMAPVAGKPFLWYLLNYLTRFDVSKVILSVGYLRGVVMDWIDEVGDEFPFSFDYAIEEEPLGTGGGIRLALSKATTNNVVVLNGDTFFDVNLNELMEAHRLYPSAVTLALKPMQDFDRYGRVIIDDIDKRIVEFKEKEYCKEGLINGGVYVINKLEPIFEGLPQNFSFETAVLVPQCELGKIYGVIQNGYFIDIGLPEEYHKANRLFPMLFALN
ncbi:MAG: nucleotidyltransferase family protein [Prevotella sp.]